ncbi:ring-cleaving dioxygenase [Metasolibacillus meyeri]|uniref:Ring-cleaving dioxygenase n=1 Tax=Metasolibacillus meyeri TaxID=1071052 RepID=A0AAW9NNX9_9BACL|nr:ring-cleaving dioxygenase [Metasolibacillus meyeri]MEC1177419.1 ring-cleaving dioxygenase [Metasolibacillus meyeri]
MKKQTAGIHHITAIVGHPQENIDFYAGVLGLRLVKQTVNFDDPSTYHLYFGNKGGQPGTIITFFPWANAYQGRIGDGQVAVTTYVVAEGALAFWVNRLAKFSIPFQKAERFDEQVIQFDDPHGLHIELVARAEGEINEWTFGEVTPEVAIKGFGGAVLYSSQPQETAKVLTEVMGLEQVATEGDYTRFKSSAAIGNTVDVKMVAGVSGQMGVGTVHHIAWRAEDDADHVQWQQHVMDHGQHVTEVKDRNYFNAIYFREPGEILFEIATDPPGFAHDETAETMGSELMLPSQYEQHRERLERTLIPIAVRELD